MSLPTTFLLLILLLLAGRWLRWRGVDEKSGGDALNRLAIDVFFPAAVLRHASSLHLDVDVAGLALLPWLGYAVAAALALALRGLRGLDRPTTAVVFLGCGFGNTAFMGYAVVPAVLGADQLRHAVVSDQLGSFVAVSTVGLFVVAVAAGQERPTARAVLRKLVTFPPFIAFVVGVTLLPRTLPTEVARALEIVAAALMPCTAVAIGLRLRFALPARHRWPLVVIVVGKLVVVPALILVVGRAVGVDDAVLDVAVLQAAMPVMVTIGALLALAGVLPELAAAMVAVSTLASMVTLPLWSVLALREGPRSEHVSDES